MSGSMQWSWSRKYAMTDTDYLAQVQAALSRDPYRRETGRVELLDAFLYIGGFSVANNTHLLRELGITHVVNCAEYRLDPTGNPYSEESGITGYLGFRAEDQEDYLMLQHFDDALKFINEAKQAGGRVLVHCAMGINRSATICAAYIMVDQQWDLLRTIRHIKERKGVVLGNTGFQMELVKFARKRGLLPKTDG